MKMHIAGKNTWLMLLLSVLGSSTVVLSCNITSTLPPIAATLTIIPSFTATSVATPSATQAPTPAYNVGSAIVSPKDGMKLMFVPAGEFLMGSQNGPENERPAHTIYLDAFWIDQTEVTNAMYTVCVKEGTCRPPFETILYDDPDFVDSPVDYVTWSDANYYCAWAGRRLPTEAEWEKAASWDDANQQKRIYSWGNTFDCSLANLYNEGDTGTGCAGYPVKTGSYPLGASYYGALDMTGNVTEWVADLYDAAYYQVSPPSNPEGPERGAYHVVRGGSYLNSALEARTTARQSGSFFDDWPTFYDMVGFRCAVSKPTSNRE